MDRYRVIERLAKQHGWRQGLELGVWLGVTTFWLMRNTNLNMTCVDAWEPQPDNPERCSGCGQNFVHATVCSYVGNIVRSIDDIGSSGYTSIMVFGGDSATGFTRTRGSQMLEATYGPSRRLRGRE